MNKYESARQQISKNSEANKARELESAERRRQEMQDNAQRELAESQRRQQKEAEINALKTQIGGLLHNHMLSIQSTQPSEQPYRLVKSLLSSFGYMDRIKLDETRNRNGPLPVL